MVERVVISRRTSEQELDLRKMLVEDAQEEERDRKVERPDMSILETGEASEGEIAIAVSEWLETLKDKVSGHNRFQLAVARNALGMIAREYDQLPPGSEPDLSLMIEEGRVSLATPEVLSELRERALRKLAVDVPKYPALAVAREKWL